MHYLAILCLISKVFAGPGWPAVIEVREGPAYHQRETFRHHPEHLYSQDMFGLEDRMGGFAATEDQGDLGVLVGSGRPSVVIRGVQEQLMEDLLRMEQDLLLIRRLLGQGSLSVPHDSRPPVFPPSPWALPVLPPTHHNPWDDEEESQRPTFGHDDSPWFRFPGLGFDRPVFHDIPGVPSGGEVPQVDELPDNYDNSTHEVHLINGSRVEVNTTTNKKSGDGFNSFFHHQVIHIRPDQDRVWEQPGDQDSTTPFPVDTTQGEEEVEESVVPEVEERVIPVLPEVENEVQSGKVTELPTRAEVATEGREKDWVSRGDAGRSLLGPNRRAAAYVINRVDSEEEYEDEERKEPDLSSDTLVNYVGSDEQGMTLVEPEAEVFNLGLVQKEAETSTRD